MCIVIITGCLFMFFMDEGYSPDNEGWSSSDSLDDIDNISLLPEIKRKPNRIRRRKVRFLRDKSFEFSGYRRMCSRRTLVYTSVTAVLLVSVVLISVFVRPSTSEEFEETSPEKRSQLQDEPHNDPKEKKKVYLDEDGKKFAWQDIRLPSNLVPLKYRVELHPNITTFKFAGTVDILIECVKNTKRIIFHAKHMELTKIKVARIIGDENLEVLKLGKLTESKELEMYSVEINDQLKTGQDYILYIDFKASLSDKLFGFYKSSYKNKRGETRHLATTHFEPTDARAAFPCFDEPALKAKFEMIIIRDDHHTALSNMPLSKTERRKDGLLKDYFQETVKMSTYLIAFVVCDFEHLSDRTPSGTLVRVWAPPDEIEQAGFALSEAKKILYYYENFFKVKFPLPKQDLIAIPDFDAGAMENWGLITYRSTSLLYDEKESSDSNKQWVATVVAHELAHQWFGNLVTMKWWNDLWLNEGFASFVENIGANFTNPEWKMMDQFLLDKTQLSMNLDQMSNSHPISVPVTNPNQINSLFDTISYDKGAAIIRMLKNFIGDEAFQHGLQNYLKSHKFGNAETRDLWSKLSEAEKKYGNQERHDVQDVMDTWTLQMGFPVVTIKRENGKASASQKHFLVHPKAKPALKSKFGYKWLIPVTYRTQRNKERKQVWMNKNDSKVYFDWSADSGWIKVNYGQQGFYRVNYEKENWQKLKNQLNTDHKVFGGADKAGLIDDAFNLARAGQLKLTTALDLTLYLVNEQEYVPWSSTLSNMGYIDAMLCRTEDDYALYKKYMLQQLTPIVNELGWQDKGSHLQKYLRASVLRLGSEYGHKKATAEAKKMFEEWRVTGKRIPPNLRNVVYAIGIREGGEVEFNHVYKQYLHATVASEKRKLMYALTSTKSHSLLTRLLKMSMDNTKIRSQDTVAVITSVAANCLGRQLAWDFVMKNWAELFKRYGTGSFDFSRLILKTASHFNTDESLKQIKTFFKSHDMGSAERAGKQSIESIQANIDWVKQNKEDALKWFIANTRRIAIKPQDLEDRMVDIEDLNPEEYAGQRDGQNEQPVYNGERQFARNYYYHPLREDYQYDDGYFRDSREVEDENEYGYGRSE